MKKTLIAIVLSCCCIAAGAETTALTLWKLKKNGSAKTWKAEVPATVAGVLADNGEFGENPFRSLNYGKIDKTQFDGVWTFSTRFRTGRKKGEHYILDFKGLNYRADIYLNGKQIAAADTTFGPFIARTYDITEIARKFRKNTLKVSLQRAREGDLNHGYVDWNPRPADESMGITGAVTLTSCGAVRIADAFVRPDLDTRSLSQADLHVEVSLQNFSGEEVQGNLSLSLEGGSAVIPVTVPAEGTTVCLGPEEVSLLHVDNPRIWWTWDLGTPEMYEMTLSFEGAAKDVSFGIRSIGRELTGEKGDHAQFILNGRPVLVKGAGWTDEIFMRDTRESNALQAEYVKDMGLNCIRFENIWGKDDDIYDCCDRMGLLAMVGFSCQWEWKGYCGLPETRGFGCINDPASEDLAVRYFKDQVIRLRNHPSIICWLTGSDCIPNARLEERYMEIYRKYEYRPYICSAKGLSSKFGGKSGMKMEGPYEYVGPDYWYLDTERGGAYGFNTETGVGMNIPQIPSLEKMMAPDSLWPVSADWAAHCTASSSAMNNTEFITKVMDASYGHAGTLEEFVNRAHALDYDATRAMFESFRCNSPESTGIIQWMLNSAWPSLYWQLYDYYKVPTAAYYGTKKACAPVQLVYNYKEHAIYGLNESGSDSVTKAGIKVYDASSSPILDVVVPCTLTDNKPVRICTLPEYTEPVFLSLELPDGTDNVYAIPAKGNTYDWKHATWYYTPIAEYADMSFVSALPEAQVALAATRDGDTVTVTLTNRSEVISWQNILRCTAPDGTLVVPAFWSDNFISLLPSQTKTVTCRVPAGTECSITMQTWNSKIL